ncbi:MAG TPA: HEAT repeat domain-containing protein [Dehalococcoidia bacterium]|nr:HEAT repeat domain-containing protein [Dehalococcoidia bacterium]
MATDIPWDKVITTLDEDENLEIASESLRQVLRRRDEGAAIVARTMAACVGGLRTPKARGRGIDLLRDYVSVIESVRDVALGLSADDDPAVRYTATSALRDVRHEPTARKRLLDLLQDPDENVRVAAVSVLGAGPSDPEVTTRLFALLGDSPNVRSAVLRAVPTLDAPSGQVGDQLSLRVIPDPAKQDEALDLLSQLEHSVFVLEELGLDEGQHRIVDELILPTLQELKLLLSSGATDPSQVQDRRKRSASRIGTVVGAAQALALTVPVIAEAGQAAENVRHAANAVQPLSDFLLHLLTAPPF